MKKIPFKFVDILLNTTFLVGALFNVGCMQFRTSDKKIIKKFSELPQQVNINRYTFEDKTMRYISIGDSTLPTVVFIHGAPGSSNAFFSYMEDSLLLQKVRMVSVDRLGYGYSHLGESVVSVATQAQSLQPLLQSLQNGKPMMLVGHSYGGTIAARLAMDYPDLVTQLILAAPAIDPENEKRFWVNKPADWAIFKWALPKAVKVSNDEKLAHEVEVAKMLPFWQNITMPVTYIHGKKDGIVPFENAAFAQKQLAHNKQTRFILEDKMGHLFIFSDKDILKNAILGYL